MRNIILFLCMVLVIIGCLGAFTADTFQQFAASLVLMIIGSVAFIVTAPKSLRN